MLVVSISKVNNAVIWFLGHNSCKLWTPASVCDTGSEQAHVSSAEEKKEKETAPNFTRQDSKDHIFKVSKQSKGARHSVNCLKDVYGKTDCG